MNEKLTAVERAKWFLIINTGGISATAGLVTYDQRSWVVGLLVLGIVWYPVLLIDYYLAQREDRST